MRPAPEVCEALKRHIERFDGTHFAEVIHSMDAGMSPEQIASNLRWPISQVHHYRRGVYAILDGNTELPSPSSFGKAAAKVRRLMRQDMPPEVEQYLSDLLDVLESRAG